MMRIAILLTALLTSAQASPAQPRASVSFHERLAAGETLERRLAPGITVRLDPDGVNRDGRIDYANGWNIRIVDDDGHDTSSMTPPFRGPNASGLLAAYFVAAGSGPTREHELMFSPEVGHTITWDVIDTMMSKNQPDAVFALLRRIEAFGSLELTVTDMSLRGTTPEDAAFDWVEFDVVVTWPASGARGK